MAAQLKNSPELLPVRITATPPARSQFGYGARISTRYMVQINRRWRRVYAYCWANCATLYIGPSLAEGQIIDTLTPDED